MSTKHLYPLPNADPETTYAAIQEVIDDKTVDTVLFHEGEFNIGPHSLQVRRALTIEGLQADPTDPKTRPVIIGTSGALYIDNAINPKTAEAYKFECGIFNVAPSRCEVKIKNLVLKHTPRSGLHIEKMKSAEELLRDAIANQRMHGSSTIAYFVDNLPTSALTVSHCEIDTAASSGISINATSEPQAGPALQPITNVSIVGCKIRGHFANKEGEAQGGGNFISVKLGNVMLNLEEPLVDLRRSTFEIKEDCHLDAAKWAGVVANKFMSDSNTVFRVEGNEIGCNRMSAPKTSRLEATRVGVYLACPAFGQVTISGNQIKLRDYFSVPDYNIPDHAAGVWVKVDNYNQNLEVATRIERNEIYFGQTSPPDWEPVTLFEQTLDGIIYEDEVAGGSRNASAVISGNVFSNAEVFPLRGIRIANGGKLITSKWVPGKPKPTEPPPSLQVYGNDMSSLTASHAQIFVANHSRYWDLWGNTYGDLGKLTNYIKEPVALLLCDGSGNKFYEDFRGCDVPGWVKLDPDHTGPGRFKLDVDSRDNEVHIDRETFEWPKDNNIMQWWDVSRLNMVDGVIWLVPVKPPRPRVGREFELPFSEISPLVQEFEGVRIGIVSEHDQQHHPALLFVAPVSQAQARSQVS